MRELYSVLSENLWELSDSTETNVLKVLQANINMKKL